MILYLALEIDVVTSRIALLGKSVVDCVVVNKAEAAILAPNSDAILFATQY